MSQITSGSQPCRTSRQSATADLQFASGEIVANLGTHLRNGDAGDSIESDNDEDYREWLHESL